METIFFAAGGVIDLKIVGVRENTAACLAVLLEY